MFVYGSKIQDIKKKEVVKTLLNIFLTVENGMAKCVSTKKIFRQF